MVWPAIIAAGASLAGGAMNMIGQSNANAQNAALAQKNMDWQEEMSNTAYQRAMADMRAAGLNPILAYQKGGASTPGMSMPDMKNVLGGFGDVGNSAMQAYRTEADVEVAGEQAKKDISQADLNRANIELTKAAEAKTKQDTVTSATQARLNNSAATSQDENALNAAITNQILHHNVTSAAGEARIRTREAEDRERYGDPNNPYARYGAGIERVGRRVIDLLYQNRRSENPTVPNPRRLNAPTHGFTWGVREPTSLKLPPRN